MAVQVVEVAWGVMSWRCTRDGMCTCIRACVGAGAAAVGTAWGMGRVGMRDQRAGRVQLGTIGGATAAGVLCVVELRQGAIVHGRRGKGGDIDVAQCHGVWVYTELSSSIQSSAVCNVDKAIAIHTRVTGIVELTFTLLRPMLMPVWGREWMWESDSEEVAVADGVVCLVAWYLLHEGLMPASPLS
ncbi:hypothetical protein K439DRAFT_1623871 [Ramaria rubella]|nr:hypothetical protein K439DRAFT_1623871 [Ramaria rubella]